MIRRLVVAAFLLLVALRSEAATVRYFLPNTTSLSDIVFTPDGRAWAATGQSILLLSGNGTAITVASANQVAELVIGSDGAVWASTPNEIIRLDPVTLDVQRYNIGFQIISFGAGPDGALWMIRSGSSTTSLLRLSTSGAILSNNPIASPASFGGWLVQAHGSMWTLSDNQVVRIDATGATQLFPLPLTGALWTVSNGTSLWIADDANNPQVVQIAANGSVIAQYPAPVRYILGATVDNEGNLLLTEEFTGRVVRLTPAGQSTVLATFPYPAVPCIWFGPEPMAVAPDGRVAVGKWVDLGPIAPPSDPCRTDPAARSMVIVFDPAQLHEIPSLSFLSLVGLAVLLALAGFLVAGRP